MVSALIIASSFIKAVIVPMLIMGLSGVLFWEIVFKRTMSRNTIILFLLTCIIYVFTKTLTEAIYISFVKLSFFPQQIFDKHINQILLYHVNKRIPDLLYLVKVILPFFVIFGYAPLSMFGFILYLLYRKKSLDLDEIWPASLFLIPLLSLLIFRLVSGGGWYIYMYATIPLSVLSTKGLISLSKDNSKKWRIYFAKSVVLLLFCLGLSTTLVQSLFPCINSRYYITRYGAKPLLTNELLSGLHWLRANSKTDAIIAVNFTQELWKEKKNWCYSESSEKGKYWYYSAFSERRIFLEGAFNTPQFHRWVNVYKQSQAHIPFADRRALLNRFFKNKDKSALTEMKDYFKVSYLLVDKRRDTNEWLRLIDHNLIQLTYSNKDVDIYKIL
jgi:hypothetical protein